MAWQYPISTNTQVNLSTTDSVYVAQYVTVGVSSNSLPAIVGTGSNQTAIINGTVAGWDSIAIGNNGSDSSGETVQISKTGNLFSDGSYSLGVYGYTSSISNAGTIHGRTTGAYLNADFDGGSSTINNSGVIEGDGSYGVLTAGTQAVELTNTGTIRGGTASFHGVGTNNDLITNKGTMTGQIDLGLGDDHYEGRHGHVLGTIAGGGGGDQIYAGAENNIIDGGAGNDFIWGSKGSDTLTGGADSDTFIFGNGDGTDEVTDFTSGKDTLELSSWKPIKTFDDFKSHAEKHGSDLWIVAGHDTLVLDHVKLSQVHEASLVF